VDGFKKYVFRGRSSAPKVTIRKCGQMSFNSGAVQKYDLYTYEFVILYISNDKGRIAIELTNNEKESGLIKIQKRPGSFAFSARNFLSLNDIDWSATVNYDFKWIPKDRLAIFKITAPGGNDAKEKNDR
jgi:hypothetical protein